MLTYADVCLTYAYVCSPLRAPLPSLTDRFREAVEQCSEVLNLLALPVQKVQILTQKALRGGAGALWSSIYLELVKYVSSYYSSNVVVKLGYRSKNDE